MTDVSRRPPRRLPCLTVLGAYALVTMAALRADEPDALPLPRAKAPRVLTLPAAPAGEKTPPPATKPRPAPDPGGATPADSGADGPAGAELPRPAGKPGRAPDPDGAKGDGATTAPKKDDAKKEPPPADGRCDECGSRRCVAKVCVPKLKEKEITKVCWDAKCEDFCVPGPSAWCGTTCRKDDCGCWSHEVWKPTCAEVRTRVVPVRKTTKRKVPSVEWRVVERCACCRAKAPCGEMPKREGDGTSPGTTATAAAAVETPDGTAADTTAPRPAAKNARSWPWATWWR